MNITIPGLGYIEFFSVIISAVLIAGIVYALFNTGWVGVRVSRVRHIILKTDLSKEEAKKEWVNIEAHFFRGGENDLKVAIIEADKLLDEAFREAGIRGSSLGDKLKNIKSSQLPNLDQVWQAHRLRNDIVHQSTFRLKRDVAEKALDIYEVTLKHLGLLE